MVTAWLFIAAVLLLVRLAASLALSVHDALEGAAGGTGCPSTHVPAADAGTAWTVTALGLGAPVAGDLAMAVVGHFG